MNQISSLMAAAEGSVAEFSGVVNFEEKKRKSNLLMSFPKIVNQLASFGEKKKKNIFSFLTADSDIFGFTLLSTGHFPHKLYPVLDRNCLISIAAQTHIAYMYRNFKIQ